jgi:hypothetical protein
MRIVTYVMGLVLLVGIPLADAAPHGHGAGRRQGFRDDRRAFDGGVHVVFSTGDVRVLRQYYGPRYRRLPPGLQKKYYRTGQLPPGWQKRIHPFPVLVERQLIVLPPDYRRGVIDGNAVIYAPRSGVYIDATVLF